jgi:hypothetical protein
MVKRCHQTETFPISYDDIWHTIRSGEHDLKERITQIRNRYESERDITGDVTKAKKSVSELKMELPGFMPSGTFSTRANNALVEYSGVLCADMDTLGEKLAGVREILKTLPFVRAVALSPSGDGLKVFFNVINDPLRHEDSFRSIRDNVRDMGIEIDEKCKDLARICFFTYDSDLWVRMEGNEILPPAEPLPRGKTNTVPSLTSADVNMTAREQIAYTLLGELRPFPEKGGYLVTCPGQSLHSQKNQAKDTWVHLDNAPNVSCVHTSCSSVIAAFNKTLQSEIGRAEKANVAYRTPYRDMRYATNLAKPNGEKDLTPKKPQIEIYTPKQLKSYVPPPDIQLVGDCHIVGDKSHTAIIGGPGGVGKSLALNWLAIAGATGTGDWFGLPVHRQFKTFIIQNENSPYRLSQNFKGLDCDMLDDWVRITAPPEYGMLLHSDDFRKELGDKIAEFLGDDSSVVAFDPFNSGAPDQEQRTYLDTFALLKSLLPQKASLMIAHHLRKPQTAELSKGRSLMFMLAGSYVLTSVPRAVFVMQPASDDVEDDQVVWTCSKNNNGELGKRSAWKRQNGIFASAGNFDWDTFDAESKDKRVVITEQMVEEVFDGGKVMLSEARDKLHELSGATKSSCYRALGKGGRFADNLAFEGKFVNWVRS